MRRLLTAVVLCAALPVVVLVGTGADGGGSSYKVRAIFDNVASAVPGEDVKVAGAKVGVIESMDVTDNKKAAMVLKIEDDRFSPFRKDAKCSVRPQSLIGEKFVECEPGTASSPELDEIQEGDGEGQHHLPLDRTSSPVDLDLVNNILRRPYAERFSILLSEFGTGLAGRGKELNEVISRANPALKETDRCSPCSHARTGCWRGWRTTPTPPSRLSRARRRRCRTSSCRPTAPVRPPPSAAPTSKRASSACRASCAS